MSTEPGTLGSKAIMRRVYAEIFSEGNLDLVDELFARDFVHHIPGFPVQGPEGQKHFVRTWRSAFPDGRFTVEDQIAEGDRVVTRVTFRGTHQGAFMGIPPTGTQVTVTGMSVDRMVNGRLVEGWAESDGLGLLHQLGAIPAPQQAGA